MDESPHSTSPSMHSRLYACCGWIVCSLIFTLAISLAAAHAPPRIRLVGLFSLAFGVLIGWVLRRLARALDADVPRTVVGVVAMIMTIAGLVGSTCEIFRLEMARRGQSTNDAIALRMIEEMENKTTPPNNEQSAPTQLQEFRRYLADRIRQLGDWPRPWPELFWLGEILAGGVASYWMSTSKPALTK
jgi:hypothetical protein